jgi:hypothetical protein
MIGTAMRLFEWYRRPSCCSKRRRKGAQIASASTARLALEPAGLAARGVAAGLATIIAVIGTMESQRIIRLLMLCVIHHHINMNGQ